MLSQCLYISTAPSLSREDVDAILDASARNNPEHGITGLLLYNGRNFLQLLEGEVEDIEALMERIGKDPRHTGVSILHVGTIGERVCPDWAMKRVIIADSISNRRQSLEEELPEGLHEDLRKMILNFAVLN